MDDFRGVHPRFYLDFSFLLDQPLRWIQPLLVHRPTDWQYLLELAAWLRQQVETLSTSGLEWGFCQGDALGGNAHLNGDVLTHFDFDDCGPGWRAYDLATYLWINAWRKPQGVSERWEEYLHAYGGHRALAAVDLDAIPAFVAIREVWVIGQQVRAASFRGH
jgi:Ser/Thr protein kinase RdoA (MazF antagonist)